VVSVQYPYTLRARAQQAQAQAQAQAAGGPVFAAQAEVVDPPPSAIYVPQAPPTGVAPVPPRPRRSGVGSVPSARTAPVPTPAPAPVADESAMALDTLTRSRLERTF
jgi:hypothetical protein